MPVASKRRLSSLRSRSDLAAHRNCKSKKPLNVPVEKIFPEHELYRVLCSEGGWYSATLTQTDLSYGVLGHNKFIVIQVLVRKNDPSRVIYLQRWVSVVLNTCIGSVCCLTKGRVQGRVGREGQYSVQSCDSASHATAVFTSKFLDKTWNEWGDRFMFKKYHGKLKS